ncbi:hypothetical protein ACH518_05045 [Methylomonas sp. HW2-6]|uniref:hypothetical protein n=1 Tax=Methylomonas sp. HW2-6 TaxID=3376687 RepID=UPI00404250C6
MLKDESYITKPSSATKAFDDLLDNLCNCRVVIPFSGIIQKICEEQLTGVVYAFIRHKKLLETKGKLEHGDYLIFRRFSFGVKNGSSFILKDLPDDEQVTLITDNYSNLNTLESDYVKLIYSDEYKGVANTLLSILHSFFVTSEMDKFLLRSAIKLIENEYGPHNNYNIRFDQLLEINAKRFGIMTAFAKKNESGKSVVFFSNIDEDLLINSRNLINVIDVTISEGQSNSDEAIVRNKTYSLRTLPLRFGNENHIGGCLILISSKNGIPVFAVKTNELVVDHFNEQRVIGIRMQFQAELQQKIIQGTSKKQTDLMTNQNNENQPSNFFDLVTAGLIKTTHAHSVTIRTYKSFKGVLELVSYADILEERNDSEIICCANKPEYISGLTFDPKESVVGFCYQNTEDKGHVYLRDVDDIPVEYKNKGLLKSRKCRTSTKSELCVPIVTKRMRFGVINLEAPFNSAFELDIEYVKNISFLVTQYLELLHSSDDNWWLSQLSFTHLATHELKDFTNLLNSTQQERLSKILYFLSPDNIFSYKSDLKWGTLFQDIESYHRRLTRCSLNQIWTISGIDPDWQISSRLLNSLRLIILSILNNTKHSVYESNRIVLEYCQDDIRLPEYRITYYSKVSYIDPERLLTLFNEPTVSDGWHFGLFLIGVHTRLLGGQIEIDPDCMKDVDFSPFTYRIRLPKDDYETA